jgi:nucleotide-binding universal stress UspA family protein
MMTNEVRTILVPIDFSECSLEALQYSVVLARAFSARVVVLHVIDVSVRYGLDAIPVPLPSAEITAKVAERVEEWVQRVARQGIEVAWHIELGVPFTEIRAAIDRHRADLVVMGTHGRRGVGHFMLGSVAERIVQRAPCPVLTVKASSTPPGMTEATKTSANEAALLRSGPGEARTMICHLCGKASTETICDSCKVRIQTEAVAKKLRVEKEGPMDIGHHETLV